MSYAIRNDKQGQRSVTGPDDVMNGEYYSDTAIEIVEQATAASISKKVDTAADAARHTVAGDPLRAVEYDRARLEAEQYAAAGYLGDVPPMVAAWAINSRTPQQAADSILAEAAQYNAALVHLRTVRLNAKELIRNAMAAGQVEQAEDIAAETITTIRSLISGVGNARD